MKRLRILLWPLSVVYAIITTLRNKIYDCGLRPSTSYDKPVICVGNITVGGTGKTPLTEYILRLLADYKPSLISRGYRRKTKGMVVATPSSTSSDIGDEPMQMHRKMPQMPVVACADRRQSIDWIIENRDTGVVVMDDGFQHRSVRAGFNIVVADYARPMWSDHVFPAGNLRETWAGRHRADMVVVNKCPADLSADEAQQMRRKMKLRDGHPTYFCTIAYGEICGTKGTEPALQRQTPVLAIAGIGRPEPFFDEVRRRFDTVETIAYADHHNFGAEDMAQIDAQLQALGPEAVVIMTEKDAQRYTQIAERKAYYLPIELKFLFGEGEEFNQKIKGYVSENQ